MVRMLDSFVLERSAFVSTYILLTRCLCNVTQKFVTQQQNVKLQVAILRSKKDEVAVSVWLGTERCYTWRMEVSDIFVRPAEWHYLAGQSILYQCDSVTSATCCYSSSLDWLDHTSA